MTTVFVLAVLWLIVVVPMIFRRADAPRRARSSAGIGATMNIFSRRESAAPRSSKRDAARDERAATSTSAARHPVPVAQEAFMHSEDHAEMSAARTQMMARRRRSLRLLGIGSVVFVALAIVTGGLFWAPAVVFVLGLLGYVTFLRGQARHDRERRLNRMDRLEKRAHLGHDVVRPIDRFVEPPESVVRIDDDDMELHNMDTIDLTGLYSEESAEPVAQRRAS